MKKIKLTQGQYALVDDEDFERVSKKKWHALYSKEKDCFYAGRRQKGDDGIYRTLFMHRFIMDPPKNKSVDHKNHNTLDNTRLNLRVCTHGENMRNSKIPKNNKTGYKGVHFNKSTGKFKSAIWFKNKFIHLGYFSNSKDAARSYNNAALRYHKDFSFLNDLS